MINIIKSQIQPLKLSQSDNQAKMHQGDIVNVLGVAGSMRKGSFRYTHTKIGARGSKKIWI